MSLVVGPLISPIASPIAEAEAKLREILLTPASRVPCQPRPHLFPESICEFIMSSIACSIESFECSVERSIE